MIKRQIGIGTASILFLVLGLLWTFSINHFCLGDYILKCLGASSWTNGNHIGILYSLIFFLPSCFIAFKWYNDWGAKLCLKLSTVMSVIIISSAIIFFL